MNQNFPGNVRELENAIERAVVFAKETVTPDHLGLSRSTDRFLQVRVAPLPEGAVSLPDGLPEMPYREAKERAVAIFEHYYFSSLRERTQANVSEAARQAGLDRSNFRRAVKRAGVAWRADEDDA